MNAPTTRQALHTAALTGLLSLAFLSPATAADFTGTLKGVTITDSQATNKPPAAAFAYTLSGETVTFDASGSSDPDGTIIEYKWDFGDGQSGTGVNATHTYATNGKFPVKLTLVDNTKCVSIINEFINILSYFILQESGSSFTNNVRQLRSEGQGFFLSSAKILNVITLKTGDTIYNTPTLKIRVGTSKDLSSNWLAESNTVTITNTGKEYDFVFQVPLSLNANTQYYFEIAATDDTSTSYINFANSNSNVYDGEGGLNFRIYGDNKRFSATTVNYTTNDLWFKMQ